jgi:hypothetical protein
VNDTVGFGAHMTLGMHGDRTRMGIGPTQIWDGPGCRIGSGAGHRFIMAAGLTSLNTDGYGYLIRCGGPLGSPGTIVIRGAAGHRYLRWWRGNPERPGILSFHRFGGLLWGWSS